MSKKQATAAPRPKDKREETQPTATPQVEAAAAVFRKFKDKHRRFFEEHSKEALAIVKKAFRRVFRQKPGPKTDPNIVGAAGERAAGKDWKALYPTYIAWYDKAPESTRALAEEGFRKKINTYIARNPRLAARRKKSLGKLRPQLPAA